MPFSTDFFLVEPRKRFLFFFSDRRLWPGKDCFLCKTLHFASCLNFSHLRNFSDIAHVSLHNFSEFAHVSHQFCNSFRFSLLFCLPCLFFFVCPFLFSLFLEIFICLPVMSAALFLLYLFSLFAFVFTSLPQFSSLVLSPPLGFHLLFFLVCILSHLPSLFLICLCFSYFRFFSLAWLFCFLICLIPDLRFAFHLALCMHFSGRGSLVVRKKIRGSLQDVSGPRKRLLKIMHRG